MGERITELETSQKAATKKADEKETVVADRLGEKAEKGKDRETEMAKLKASITALKGKVAAPATSDKERAGVLRELADQEKALTRLENQEKRTEAIAKSKLWRAEEARIRAEDISLAEALITTIAAIPDVPAAPAATTTEAVAAGSKAKSTPERGGSLSDRADSFVYGMAMNIIGSPPKTPWEKFTTSSKVVLMQLTLAFSKGDHSWGDALSGPEKVILEKVTGMKLSPAGPVPPADGATPDPNEVRKNKYTIEFGKPDAEFLGPDAITQKVFAEYFGTQEWMGPYERLSSISNSSGEKGKASIEELRNYLGAHPDDGNATVTKLLDALVSQGGAKENAVFLEAVSKKGYSVLSKA